MTVRPATRPQPPQQAVEELFFDARETLAAPLSENLAQLRTVAGTFAQIAVLSKLSGLAIDPSEFFTLTQQAQTTGTSARDVFFEKFGTQLSLLARIKIAVFFRLFGPHIIDKIIEAVLQKAQQMARDFRPKEFWEQNKEQILQEIRNFIACGADPAALATWANGENSGPLGERVVARITTFLPEIQFFENSPNLNKFFNWLLRYLLQKEGPSAIEELFTSLPKNPSVLKGLFQALQKAFIRLATPDTMPQTPNTTPPPEELVEKIEKLLQTLQGLTENPTTTFTRNIAIAIAKRVLNSLQDLLNTLPEAVLENLAPDIANALQDPSTSTAQDVENSQKAAEKAAIRAAPILARSSVQEALQENHVTNTRVAVAAGALAGIFAVATGGLSLAVLGAFVGTGAIAHRATTTAVGAATNTLSNTLDSTLSPVPQFVAQVLPHVLHRTARLLST